MFLEHPCILEDGLALLQCALENVIYANRN